MERHTAAVLRVRDEYSQQIAGERLRADFTRAQLMPHITANWTAGAAGEGQHGGSLYR